MNNEIKSYMHVALVLDASGSMDSLRSTTIASLKKFFDGLRSAEDKTLLDVWQFDGDVSHLVDSADINAGAPQTLENYTIGGSTALFDAICIGIDTLGAKFDAQAVSQRPDGVVFAILTDGFENASRRFTRDDVRRRIAHQSEKYAWRFKFLAANQDAITAGRDFGIAAESCVKFEASHKGMMAMCEADAFLPHSCEEMRMCAREIRAAHRKRAK